MEPRLSNMQPFSIAVPGIEQPITSKDVFSQFTPGLLSNLPVSHDAGAFEYSEGQLGALLGETGPVHHPNLNTSIYTHRMNAKCAQYEQSSSPAWSVATVGSILGAVSTAMIYKYVPGLSPSTRNTLVLTVMVMAGLAFVSCFAASAPSNVQTKQRSYSYIDFFAAQPSHVTWKEYWQGMMIEGCSRKKLKQVAKRAKEFGFRMRQLSKPNLSTKQDGTPLSGADIRKFMMQNDDAGFAAITGLLWAVEAARWAVGKPLRMEIGSVSSNAKFFLKLAEAMSGRKPKDLSLPAPYSQPLADLLDGAAFYAGLGNKVPTQSAALAALLARYYYDHGGKDNASLMMYSMQYLLLGRWRSAFESHLSALRRPVNEGVVAERRVVNAIHHLGIAQLIRERVIDGYGHEVIPSAYAYAYSAAHAFNTLAYEKLEAPLHFQALTSRAVEIMRVMSENGPFVEFR